MRTVSRYAVVLALGFFSLVAQTLLFRDFLTAFEGNEFGIGAFFASWLLWVAVGAVVGRAASVGWPAVASHFRYLALLYVPAYLVQQALILRIRSLTGVAAYEIFPFVPMFALSFLVNAPVSLMTGFLFTLACRWAADHSEAPVSRVYVFETLGAFAGGLWVTLVLTGIGTAEFAFAASAWLLVSVVILEVFAGRDSSRSRRVSCVFLVTIPLFVLAFSDITERWTFSNDRAAWSRLLPPEYFKGAFSTSQARYLYGEREGQFIVMSGGGTCEALPGDQHAGEIAAINLAEHPKARNVLVFGENALGICARLKTLSQIDRVTWMHPDPQYPERIAMVLTNRVMNPKLMPDIEALDIRDFARKTEQRFDLVILNLPDVTTLALNRYCTIGFFQILEGLLAENGVVSVRISGGENYLGGELALLGASMTHTLGEVFRKTALKPGDETWFFASNGDGLSESASALGERFASVESARSLYPPEAVPNLFPPNRIQTQRQAYAKTLEATRRERLLNTDRSPVVLFYELLLALKQAGWRLPAKMYPFVDHIVLWAALTPPALLVLLRFLYYLRSRRASGSAGAYDGQLLVFSTGVAGMGFSVVLMFLYQGQFGSLFGEIGLVSALFMLGSFLGGAASTRVAGGGRALLGLLLVAHGSLLLAVAHAPVTPSRTIWMAAFLASGVLTGAYFPIGARRLADAQYSVSVSGARLEMLDHVGGALGALLVSLVLLPILGNWSTGCVLAALVAVNLVGVALPWRGGCAADGVDQFARSLGYAAGGVAVFALVLSHVIAADAQKAAAVDRVTKLRSVAQTLVKTATLTQRSAQLADGVTVDYFEVRDSGVEPIDPPAGYVFDSQPWAGRVQGYLGPIGLAVYVDAAGGFRDYAVLESFETPAYMYMVEARKGRLKGKKVFDDDPFKGVDGVSGATITDVAVRDILALAGQGFAKDVLKHSGATAEPTGGGWRLTLDQPGLREFLCLLIAALSAVAARYHPHVWVRRVFLTTMVVVFGFMLNTQYSMQQVFSLLSLNVGSVGLNGPFFLLIAVPVVVFVFGNVYCGYLCPFGALQELAGDLFAAPWRRTLEKRIWRYGRMVKYALLFGMVVLYALTRDFGSLDADPLVSFFAWSSGQIVLAVALVTIALSLCFGRFWCRNLCPAGAFLSLLAFLPMPRWLRPARQPAFCDLGVRTAEDVDCIHCDRCNVSCSPARREALESRVYARWVGWVFLALVLGGAALLCVEAVPRAWPTMGIAETHIETETPSERVPSEVVSPIVPRSPGKARDVDMNRINQMIRNGNLSDHPAEYSRPLPAAPSP